MGWHRLRYQSAVSLSPTCDSRHHGRMLATEETGCEYERARKEQLTTIRTGQKPQNHGNFHHQFEDFHYKASKKSYTKIWIPQLETRKPSESALFRLSLSGSTSMDALTRPFSSSTKLLLMASKSLASPKRGFQVTHGKSPD